MVSFQSLMAFLNSSGLLHNALISPLVLILADFFTGLGSSLKNKSFAFGRLSDILGHESDLLKYVVGALALVAANGLHILTPELNTLLGGVGSGILDVAILASVLNNLIELLPQQWQPEARALASEFEAAVKADLAPASVPFAPVQAPLAADQMATVSVPAVTSVDLSGGTAIQNMGAPVQVQYQTQFKMPSGLVTQG